MNQATGLSRSGVLAVVGASALALSGCMGPTYGTGKPATSQFIEDLAQSVTLGNPDKKHIDYKPRPGLVEPTDTTTLPPPQQNIAEASPDWPESPEERLVRIKKEIDEGRRLPNLSQIDDPDKPLQNNIHRQATAGKRVYLTDPPSEFRQPAQSAAYGELGPTESAKERARKKAEGKSKTGWRRFVPWG